MADNEWNLIKLFPDGLKLVAVIIGFLTISLNSLMVHVLRKKRNRRPLETFLLSLSLCEVIIIMPQIFAALCMQLFPIFTKYWIVASYFWKLWEKLTSLIHLMFISGDRLWAVRAPIHHLVNATGKKLTAAVVLCWCVPPLIAGTNTTYTLLKGMPSKKMFSSLNRFLSITILVADTVFFICYCTIIYVVCRTKNTKRNPVRSTLSNTINVPRHQMRTLLLCVGTVLIFVITTTPLVVTYLIDWNAPLMLQISGALMYPLNALATAVLFLSQNYCCKRSRVELFTRNRNQQTARTYLERNNCNINDTNNPEIQNV